GGGGRWRLVAVGRSGGRWGNRALLSVPWVGVHQSGDAQRSPEKLAERRRPARRAGSAWRIRSGQRCPREVRRPALAGSVSPTLETAQNRLPERHLGCSAPT